ncbi:hypothetical protein [Bifidobacterium aemilianum]
MAPLTGQTGGMQGLEAGLQVGQNVVYVLGADGQADGALMDA